MMHHKDFAAFILTHGRPDRVRTITSIRRAGYTGRIYLIIDNEDAAADDYRNKYGADVIMFDKAAIAQTFDECDNFHLPRKSIVYARNACYGIAKDLGLKYFLQLDDDYSHFEHRFNPALEWEHFPARKLDQVFDAMLDFYESTPAKIMAFFQGGDYIGGRNNKHLKTLRMKRKVMNSLFCSVERPVTFIGRINEDVNTYTLMGFRGDLLLSIPNANIVQETTQESDGGMSDIYRSAGTYLKSFYSVMLCPSFVAVADMGEQHRRVHHRVRWANATPMILAETHRKPDANP